MKAQKYFIFSDIVRDYSEKQVLFEGILHFFE